MKPAFFLHEAVRAMRRNAAPSFAALATVLVTMLVLGVFIPIVQATNGGDGPRFVAAVLPDELGHRPGF